MEAFKDVLCRIGMGLGFLGVIILILTGLDGIAAFRTPVDLYAEETDYNKLSKVDCVYADFDISLGCFVEEETTTKKNGAVTNRKYDYYYAIPVYSGDDVYWIGIKSSQSEMRTWEKITDETYDFLNGESDYFGKTTISKYGRVKKLDNKKYEYMVECFEEIGYFEDDSQISKYVLPCYIDTFQPKATRNLFLVGIAGTVIGIFSLLAYFGFFHREKNSAQVPQ